MLKVVASSVGIGWVDNLPCPFHANIKIVDPVETVQVLLPGLYGSNMGKYLKIWCWDRS